MIVARYTSRRHAVSRGPDDLVLRDSEQGIRELQSAKNPDPRKPFGPGIPP